MALHRPLQPATADAAKLAVTSSQARVKLASRVTSHDPRESAQSRVSLSLESVSVSSQSRFLPQSQSVPDALKDFSRLQPPIAGRVCTTSAAAAGQCGAPTDLTEAVNGWRLLWRRNPITIGPKHAGGGFSIDPTSARWGLLPNVPRSWGDFNVAHPSPDVSRTNDRSEIPPHPPPPRCLPN